MPSTVIIVVAGYAITSGMVAVAVAIAITASVVMNKMFAVPDVGSYGGAGDSPDNVGNRQQVPPATNNKLPVVYGSAWVGGTITDLSITNNNQILYYVVSLCEVTGNGTDTFSFGDMYYGGKKVQFDPTNQYKVVGLLDESTGIVDTKAAQYIEVYKFRNGSNAPTNQVQSAITIMSNPDCAYQWNSTKLMTNTVFAIIKLTYNSSAGVTGMQQTRFQVTNSRSSAGDCFYDYLTSTVYGGAIPVSQVNTDSLDELNAYGDELFTYTDYEGNTTTQPRFKFNGVIDTAKQIMPNLQDMSSCCDCLIKYNEITAQWGVIVQKPTYDIVMDLNDSNIVSAITITPIDLAGTYNVAEVKYPDNANQDSFNSVTFDLAQIDPSLMFPNEPVNKQSLTLPLCNNDVQAQYLATRFLKSAREDLQVQVNVNFTGIQLEAGDIVTITNSNYGWVAKEFRINKVVEEFADDGAVLAKLTLGEFNSQIYDDANITQFTPAPNTGIGDPLFFGTIPVPVVSSVLAGGANPSIILDVTSSSSGISQYAEIWYSAYSDPTTAQRLFGGTTAVQSAGNPYQPSSTMGNVVIGGLPAGDYYFFSRMVNSLGSSIFSAPSSLVVWRPTTFQFSQRYLVVAYADNATGTVGFTTNPRNKAYWGIANASSSSPISNPALFSWYLADPAFSTNNFLLFINYGTRKFGFGTGQADYASVTGSFVPSDTANYDPSVWSGLPDGTNYIDLDHRTGQLTETGTTTVGTGEIRVTNNANGRVVAALAPLLNFGGAGTYTATPSSITIDVFGRVLGFEVPDQFGYTMQQFTASAGQTVFTVTRSLTYLINNCWVFQNGCWLDPSEFTDTAGLTGTVTLTVGADIYDIITIVSFKSYNPLTLTAYDSFTINTVDLVNVNSYTASGFTLRNGYELLFLNGTAINEQDYDIVGQTITNFPSQLTGKLSILQWSQNNLNIPNGTPINVVTNSVIGQDVYPFSYVSGALNIYQNGVLLDEATDYTAGFGEYTLANVPTDVNQILLQQTFDRTGAA